MAMLDPRIRNARRLASSTARLADAGEPFAQRWDCDGDDCPPSDDNSPVLFGPVLSVSTQEVVLGTGLNDYGTSYSQSASLSWSPQNDDIDGKVIVSNIGTESAAAVSVRLVLWFSDGSAAYFRPPQFSEVQAGGTLDIPFKWVGALTDRGGATPVYLFGIVDDALDPLDKPAIELVKAAKNSVQLGGLIVSRLSRHVTCALNEAVIPNLSTGQILAEAGTRFELFLVSTGAGKDADLVCQLEAGPITFASLKNKAPRLLHDDLSLQPSTSLILDSRTGFQVDSTQLKPMSPGANVTNNGRSWTIAFNDSDTDADYDDYVFRIIVR